MPTSTSTTILIANYFRSHTDGVTRGRIQVKPRAQVMNLARLHQAAILTSKNLASPFELMKVGF